ncbi:hypothetical protein NFI96_016362 [Prochilodus magdalenae]|nr:hypothetical protein NFI96_016362 [Prochilodus magdalenae]
MTPVVIMPVWSLARTAPTPLAQLIQLQLPHTTPQHPTPLLLLLQLLTVQAHHLQLLQLKMAPHRTPPRQFHHPFLRRSLRLTLPVSLAASC